MLNLNHPCTGDGVGGRCVDQETGSGKPNGSRAGEGEKKKKPDPRVAICVQQRFRSSCTAFLVNSELQTKRSAMRGQQLCLFDLFEVYANIFREKC